MEFECCIYFTPRLKLNVHKRSEDVQDVFRRSYVRSIYVLCIEDYVSYFYSQMNEGGQGTCMKCALFVK